MTGWGECGCAVCSYIMQCVIILRSPCWHVFDRKRPCHEEEDLGWLVALFVFCSTCLFVYVRLSGCVCTACFNIACMSDYMHNVIPAIPCFARWVLSTVPWQIAVQKGSAVFKSTNPSANHSLAFWFTLAVCFQRGSDIVGATNNAFLKTKKHPPTTL